MLAVWRELLYWRRTAATYQSDTKQRQRIPANKNFALNCGDCGQRGCHLFTHATANNERDGCLENRRTSKCCRLLGMSLKDTQDIIKGISSACSVFEKCQGIIGAYRVVSPVNFAKKTFECQRLLRGL